MSNFPYASATRFFLPSIRLFWEYPGMMIGSYSLDEKVYFVECVYVLAWRVETISDVAGE
jgi:hypothetical protein